MKAVFFRQVVPVKSKKYNHEKVYIAHPTEMAVIIPGISGNFEFESSHTEKVAIGLTTEEMMVYKRGSDFFILENNYYKAKRKHGVPV